MRPWTRSSGGRADAPRPLGDAYWSKESPTRLGERGEMEDGSGLLPVVMEEEEGSSQTVSVAMTGSNTSPNAKARTSQSGSSKEDRLSDSSQSKAQRHSDADGAHGDPKSESGTATEKEETSVVSDSSEVFREERTSQSPTDKEVEAEFQRLSLGFKCDLFTLDKRLRLEERSRDLAEENVRKEISSCQGLLQALLPLCDDDSQSMELIRRLQKNLEILVQSMTRVSSRSEMLGAIHQEHRIGKAVEVMIHHVENLKRACTKEHTELLELRQTLLQNERSFGSQTDKADFRGKQQLPYYNKQSARRVSIASIPRSGGSPGMESNLSESEAERLTRRSPWTLPGKSASRPPLKRFSSSGAWLEPSRAGPATNGASYLDGQWDTEPWDPPPPVATERRRSSLTELGIKLSSFILPMKISSPGPPSAADPLVSLPPPSHAKTPTVTSTPSVVRGGRGLWLWLAMAVVLAGLLALLASLALQPVADAAPVGTGDSWTTIQQLLWPYAGLRHNGQPPV